MILEMITSKLIIIKLHDARKQSLKLILQGISTYYYHYFLISELNLTLKINKLYRGLNVKESFF